MTASSFMFPELVIFVYENRLEITLRWDASNIRQWKASPGELNSLLDGTNDPVLGRDPMTTVSFEDIEPFLKALDVNHSVLSVNIVNPHILTAGQKSERITIDILKILHGKSNIQQFSCYGTCTPTIHHAILSMIETLSLDDLRLSYVRGLDHVTGILTLTKPLTRLTVDFHSVNQGFADFIVDAMDHVEILIIINRIKDDDLSAISERLKTNKSIRKLQLRDDNLNLTPFGEALKVNSTLRTLDVKGSYDDPGPILDGLLANTSLLKLRLETFDPDSLASGLIRLLNINRYLEDLTINLVSEPPNMADLITAIAHSSLIVLKMDMSENFNYDALVAGLLSNLGTNTTLASLSLMYESYENHRLDIGILSDFLIRNHTMQTLLIHDIEFVGTIKPEVANNMTLTRVSSKMPQDLKDITKRNSLNKQQRISTLFGLTSHVMY